jgi:two-component sensor histidine kinase
MTLKSYPSKSIRFFVLIILFLTTVVPCSSQTRKLDSLLTIYRSDSTFATADLLNAIGGQYYIQYDLEGFNTALNFHQLALDVSKKNNDKKSVARSYRLIAAVYDAVNMNLDTAVIYYQNYLNYQLQTKDTIRIIDGYNNLLVMNYKLNRPDEQMLIADKLYLYLKNYKESAAIKYKNSLSLFYSQQNLLLKANELITEINLNRDAGEDSDNFRNYYYAKYFLLHSQKKHADAIVFLNSVLTAAQLTTDSINITSFLSQNYEAIEDYKNAFAILKLESKLIMKYTNDADRTKIAETAAFYINHKKEEERIFLIDKAANEIKIRRYIILLAVSITLLALFIAYSYIKAKRQNKRLKNKKDALLLLNDEKTLYLKEIHHRVKNNLQFVSSMLDLQIHDVKDAKIKAACKEMQMRIQSMTMVHKRLYEGDEINNINLSLYFESIFNTIYRSFNLQQKTIRFNSQSAGIFLNIDYALPLGLIVNELATNSLKHAFSERQDGDIQITLVKKENEFFSFQYSDNGTGLIDIENIDKITTSSFGLKLVKLMVKKLKSKLIIENNSYGLKFLFDFKIKP